MKAILVIDMPGYCDDCPLMFENDCGVTQTHMQLEYGELYYPKPSWCPLKSIPHKDKYDVNNYAIVDYENDITLGHYVNMGWNDCIDTILENNNETNI